MRVLTSRFRNALSSRLQFPRPSSVVHVANGARNLSSGKPLILGFAGGAGCAVLAFGGAQASRPALLEDRRAASSAFREYAMHGSTERLRKLAGTSDVHAQDADSGRTALHMAAFWGHIETVTYLLDGCKLDPNVVDCTGDTALHDAARFGHRAVIDKLVAAGASPDIKNKAGKSCADLAQEYGKGNIVSRGKPADEGLRLSTQCAMVSLTQLNSMDAATFEETLGGIYENSPWVARTAAKVRPFASLRELADTMEKVVNCADDEAKLKLLRAHPELAGKVAAAGDLSAESAEEQARAGLSQCTPEELRQFTVSNEAYSSKFGFPFILAVRNATKGAILGAFERRLKNDNAAERSECLGQVKKIAYMRLREKVEHAPTGFLTCHVLDTARGSPAAGLRIVLRRKLASGQWQELGSWVTNADGRLPGGPALKGAEHRAGVYEWTFYVAEYFAKAGVPIGSTPFLDEVPIRFGIDDPESHYHVPLLVSPWSFSTYRGS